MKEYLMFIIWGSMHKKNEEGSMEQICASCRHDSLTVYSIRKWFTLFFVPVFPYGSKEYYMICLECTINYPLDREEIEEEIKR